MQNYNVDISSPGGPIVFYAMQADSLSRFFTITVTDNGTPWEIPSGALWSVRFGAPQMPSGWYDTIEEVDGSTHPAVNATENVATVEIAEQALSTPGQNALCVLVTDSDGYQIASWPIILSIQAVPGLTAPEVTTYYNLLTGQLAQVLQNAQAAAQSAADAQEYAQQAQQVSQGAVGYYETASALEAAHPTGEAGNWAIVGESDTIYVWDTDTNAWVGTGSNINLSQYYTKTQSDARYALGTDGTANSAETCTGNAATATKFASSVSIGNATFDGSQSITLEQIGAMSETSGVYSSSAAVDTGKVWTDNSLIYRKVYAFGGLPNATTLDIPHNIQSIGAVVALYGAASNGSGTFLPLPFASSGNRAVEVQVNGPYIRLVTFQDWTSFTSGFVVIEYTTEEG